ncbi:Type II secretion system protein F [bacterium HR36]|nr:Type II secretion system protein F [bacterium HR36]
MPTYKFEAMSAKGEEVKDSIEAASEEEAQQKIRQMGYFVTRLQEVRDGRKKAGKAGKKKEKKGKTFTIGGVSQKQLCTFTRQFSVLQDAGLPVLRSLKILKGQMKPGVLKNALIDVVDDVESGSALSEALARHPKVFDRLYVNMVRAGEVGGALEVILRRLADFKEKAQSLKRKVIGAMIYPVVVILAAIAILSFIMIAIVPKFKEIFTNFEMKLPAMTQTLLDISDFMKNYFWIMPLVLIGWLIFCRLLRLMYWGRYVLDWIWLHVPVIGGILEKTIVARTMRTLGTLVSSGVPILEALSIVKETAGNAVFEEMFQRVFESVREGESIAMPMKESRLVDDMVVNMIDVGEETGELDKMLNKIADVYDEEVDVLVQGLVKLLEPLMVLFLGGCVGFIVVALFMPMLAILEKLSAGAGG